MSMSGVDAHDAKIICDMTFSQAGEKDPREVRDDMRPDVARGTRGVRDTKPGEPGEPPGVDELLEKMIGRLEKIRVIGLMASGVFPARTPPVPVRKEESFDELLEKMVERQIMLQMFRSQANS